MRWNLKPVSALKALAVTVSAWTLCVAPVAQGAEAAYNQKQLISQYLKESGLTTQKTTIGQFWGRVRHIYPVVLQKQLDPWMKIHANEMMPSIQASSFKDSDNVEQVRLVLTSGSESNTLTFTGNDDKPMKVNGVTLTRAELADYNKFEQLAAKVASQDPVLKKSTQQNSQSSASTEKRMLKGRDIAKLPLRQQMEYFLKMRTAVQAADHVLDVYKGTKGASYEYQQPQDAVAALWQVLLGANAVAKVDSACIASGWVASYYKGSCARPEEGQASLLRQVQELPFNDSVKSKVTSCAKGGGLPCNPLLFGFSDNSGNPICITSNLSSATKQCNEKVPLPQDKEKIIQSIVAARGGDASLCKLEGNNTVSQACSDKLEKYTENLQQHYLNAAQFCTKGGVNSIASRSEWEAKARTDIRKDQKEACDNLKDRYFDLSVALSQQPVAATGPACEVQGASKNDKGECVCSDGKPPRPQPKSARSGGRRAIGGGNKSLPPPPAPGQGGDSSDSSGGGQLTCTPVDVNTGSGDVTNTNLPGGKAVPQDTCGFLCKYKGVLIAAGIGLVGFGLFWWLTKKKSNSSTPAYVPPAGTDTTTVTTSPTATTTISPIPSNPCPAPNTVVNGVCTAPIYTPPPPVTVPTTPTESTSTTSGPTGAAIR